MNIQNLLSSISPSSNEQDKTNNSQPASPLDAISSMLPGGLAGGAAAGGIMALLMGSKSTRKMAKKVAKLGGTAVLGGLAYKAYDNWQKNKALGQTAAVTDQDIAQAGSALPQLNDKNLHITLITAMVAASKADDEIDAQEQKKLFDAINKLNFNSDEKAAVFDLMGREIALNEITDGIQSEEHKAEVYLAAYLAIEVDDQRERAFLNDLAIALGLPKGLPAYLEQQADQGVIAE